MPATGGKGQAEAPLTGRVRVTSLCACLSLVATDTKMTASHDHKEYSTPFEVIGYVESMFVVELSTPAAMECREEYLNARVLVWFKFTGQSLN
jgi:hypothetical protein